MKKYKVFILTIIFIFNLSLTVFAQETFLNINVNGNLKKGSEIDIIINVENIRKLYAGDIRLNFDKESMELLSFKSGNLINNKDINKLEFGGKIDKSKNDLAYQFTCTGKVEGFSGSGDLAIIKAKLLKDINPSFIDSDKLKIQLCERNEKGSIEFINYKVKNNKELDKTTNEVDKDKPSNETLVDRIKDFFAFKNEKENNSSKDINLKENETNKVNIEAREKENKKNDYKAADENKKQGINVNKDNADKKNNGVLDESKESSNKNNKEHDELQSQNNKVNKSNKINKSIAIILIFLIIILTAMYYKNKRK